MLDHTKTMRSNVHQGWLLILLTTCLVLFTALQASGSLLTREFALVSQSRSYSIFFLRTISELAGLSLAATLATTLERAKWATVAINTWDAKNGPKGSRRPASMVQFLALDVGTTIAGLLQLLASPSVTSARARLWSFGHLAAMAVVPIAGILIMSSAPLHVFHHSMLMLFFLQAELNFSRFSEPLDRLSRGMVRTR